MDIDLRSDTLTLPSPAMLDAAHHAPLGDDVYGEDSTVAALEHRVAGLLGFAGGLFCPSGTMANLCALLTHAARGRRVVCGRHSHVYCWEAGGASVLGGLVYHPLEDLPAGAPSVADVEAALSDDDDPHVAPPGVLALENTHSRAGGVPLEPVHVAALVAVADAARVPVHIDGARLFNAAVALGVSPQALVAGASSAQVCLSKGLGAPIGSVLVGSTDFVVRARRMRKMLGGGMRQAGVIAAMGLVALDGGRAHLAVDHDRAQRFATGLTRSCRRWLEVDAPRTNVVLLHPRPGGPSAAAIVTAAREEGVLLSTLGPQVARAVFHRDLDDHSATGALAAFSRMAPRLGPT